MTVEKRMSSHKNNISDFEKKEEWYIENSRTNQTSRNVNSFGKTNRNITTTIEYKHNISGFCWTNTFCPTKPKKQ